MRRPKWVAALVLALAIAGAFAWLGQWQMNIAITPKDPEAVSLESVRPLEQLTQPGESVTDTVAGAILETSGHFIPGDFSVIETRMNQQVEGVWVTGHFATADGHLPVAIGWAPSRTDADMAIQHIEALMGDTESEFAALSLTGRYLPPEAAMLPARAGDPQQQITMVPGHLINVWQPFSGASYSGYLVLHADDSEVFTADQLADVGLSQVDSFPPLPPETVNWLNVFYALEWIVFGGFAIFFWYRLARDDWEREHEMQALLQAEAAAHEASSNVPLP